MNKSRTLHGFWASFGWNAYEQNLVPDDAEFPYITYDVQLDNLGQPLYLSAALFDRSTSWASVTEKADEIAAEIGQGLVLTLDNGFLWIVRGTPFAQHGQDDDDTVRRMDINISAEFLTAI